MAAVKLVILYIGFLHICFTVADVSSTCLSCICHVEGCESQVGKCRHDSGSPSCGPYQIKRPYWIDCGKPGGDYETCTKQMECSETCVRAYYERWGQRCTGGREPTCQDYARIHNGGPQGCRRSSTLKHWQRVEECCKRTGRNCDDDQSSSPSPTASKASISVYIMYCTVTVTMMILFAVCVVH